MSPVRGHICAKALTSSTYAGRTSVTGIYKSYNITDPKPKLFWDEYFSPFKKTFVKLLPSSVCDSILVTGALKLLNNINFRHIWNKHNYTKACLYPLMPSQQFFLTYLKISKIYHSLNYVAHLDLSNSF